MPSTPQPSMFDPDRTSSRTFSSILIMNALHALVIFFLASYVIPPSSPRLMAVYAVMCLIFARVLFLTTCTLARKQAFAEIAIVTLFLATLYSGAAYSASLAGEEVGLTQVVAAIFFVFGSYLTIESEYKRYLWKKLPSSKGKAYTEGLFKYATHINYTGEVFSYAGLGLMTGSLWGALIPLSVLLGFIFNSIPELDAYLVKRYPSFKAYAATTAKLFPGIY
eukprot:TRINITY_DN7665_c0_g1_i1.p1 TRINITY_DN7665_c0_g1~~TRINITY_DN7665_c0_g1_i1.p1  ORF type:complete len:239 (-),score=56.69 TRINITY_DN7665_c0_g1_i1:110-775(-)